ncbi:MAG: hypothetical protein IT459_10820 [Planctomycetes bacterium]|nr:hypothetical protein [Planctomycetota bacterium]
MNRSVLAILAAAAFTLAPAVHARQLYWATYDYAVPSTIPSSTTSWRRAAVGDFDGDRHTDFVSLLVNPSTGSGEVLFVQAADVYQSLHSLGTRTAADLVGWPGAGVDKTDAFLSIGSGGVSLWTLGTNDQIEPTSILGSPLSGGKFIRGPVSGTAIGNHAFVVVGSDARTVHKLYRSGGTWTSSVIRTHGADILDVEILDWNGSGDRDIALMTASGLTVIDTSNTVLSSASASGVCITTVRHKGRSTDQLAWVTNVTGTSNQKIHVVGDGVTETGIVIGPLDVADVAAGDLDADGDSEVLLSHRFSGDQVILVNVSTTTTNSESFSWSAYELYTLAGWGVSFASNAATPVIADLDADTDLDVAFLCQPTTRLEIARNQRVEENDLRVLPIEIPNDDLPRMTVYDYTQSVRIQLPLKGPLTSSSRDVLEVKAWIQPVESSVTPNLVHHEVISTGSTWSIPVLLDVIVEADWQPREGDRLYLELRMIDVDNVGEYASTGPVSTLVCDGSDAGFHVDEAAFDDLYLGYGPPAFSARFIVDSAIVPFDSGDPNPNTPVITDSSMNPSAADPNYEFQILDETVAFGTKKGGASTGGTSTVPNVDPFDPNNPPPPPPRRP